ncbi:voltage-dependent T-type calcium channel subunit alpha-1I isoform X2 [Octopus bimaculoides]|uniref:voltage-dependent T-type calcium channel subunit alpha-1I isoform X2 n=1 Tax=Octopus bimaculoides TaxID=37653 RepID=UPI0022E5738D|nr:voltage-dependent T-type calcium channel subunit alpha-1I isoform X2 [Octopus bimaculoides]
MGVIMMNCITLGMYRPCLDQVCNSTRCKMLELCDHFIFVFFTVEMIIKMIAMGLIGKLTFLADSWNRLDCFIVLAGSVEYAVDTENLSISAIRTIRVLRPLRAINRIPSMRILVMLLLDTLPMLGNVLLLCFFVFFIFGIIGVQLWAGVLRNRCFLNLSANISVPSKMNVSPYYKPRFGDYICSKPGESGMRKCSNLPLFSYEGIKCNASAKANNNNNPANDSCVNWNQYYTSCETGDKNPFRGAISFDNIGLAWVAIFQVISLESWVNIMYYVQDAHSFWDWVYFVALIVIGSFFMINLCLVVIATQFSETKKRETERMLQERKRFQSSSTLASNSEPGSCYAEILKYIAHLWRRTKRKIMKRYFDSRGKRQRKINPEKAISLQRKKMKKKGMQPTMYLHRPHYRHHIHSCLIANLDNQQLHTDNSAQAPRASPEVSDVDPVSSPRRPNFLTLPSSNNSSLNPSSESLVPNPSGIICSGCQSAAGSSLGQPSDLTSGQPYKPASTSNYLHMISSAGPCVTVSRAASFNSGMSQRSSRNVPWLPEVLTVPGSKNTALAPPNALTSDLDVKSQSVSEQGALAESLLVDILGEKRLSAPQLTCTHNECDAHLSHFSHSEQEVTDSGESDIEGEWREETVIPSKWKKLMKSEILTKSQGYLKKAVESKIFQRGILLAILINTLSMGIEYHNQPEELTQALEYSNIVFSFLFAVEMLLKVAAYGLFGYISDGFNLFDGFIVVLSIIELAQDGAGGLSVLRTFRLLRILKLVRFLPALRRQLIVMLRTMDNVATFFALLILFMFIFSILGMNLFGCKFCGQKRIMSTQTYSYAHHNCSRKNFDSLLWSILTVFQVLTQEDWNTVLYNGMDKTSAWASLYFIALMTFGNYVLFNLLVAILVEGFSTEEDEKKREKDKNKMTENNNNEEVKESLQMNECEIHEKNNQEKEKKMLALPCAGATDPLTSSMNMCLSRELAAIPLPDGPGNPPIITHTAATPMATPQGSPNEMLTKDTNNKLSVIRPVLQRQSTVHRSSLSVESSDRSSVSLSFRGSPRPSPRLRRTSSRGSTRSSWRLKHRKKEGDKTNLMIDSPSDSTDELEDDVFSNKSISPIYSPGTPKSATNHSFSVTYIFSECNGQPPLNNQRTLSPQNSIKSQHALSRQNSIKSHHSFTSKNSIRGNRSWSRNNSISSSYSIHRSFSLHRENSLKSHHTHNSTSSSTFKEEYKLNNLSSELPVAKTAADKCLEELEDDPDAIDETNCVCSWCPEPKGCFKEREEYALYVLSPSNTLRRLCHHMISRRWFDYSVLFFIALNCITLAMERPNISSGSTERLFLTYSNYGFTVIFSLEMTLKVLAKGWIIGRHAYLKSGWNIMDGFLVIISLIDITISCTAQSSPRIFGILRVFRLLRTLRPLRVISRAPGLKLVVQTLLSSLRPIGNIVLICCTFFIIFGILGVQLFKGTFHYCHGPHVQNVTNKTDCMKDPRNRWRNQKYNFDNLGQALMALFVLASKDGWVSIMYTGLDAVGVDLQPKENYNEWRLLYFISFLLLVGFFVLNMFVGVVVENFHKCRESQEQEERARRDAKRKQKMEKKKKKLREPPYWASYSRARLLIHTVINSKYFDLAIAGVIGLNVITMATEYYLMPEGLEFALKIFNYFFTSVFILEATMKMVALGFMRYMRERWNQLDTAIVILSVVGIVLEEMESNVIPMNPTIIRVMRVLRIARVLKLLKMAKGIRALLDTVMQALPQVGNLGLLFFLLFFIFAALGVELFGRLDCSEEHPCEGLGDHAHFRHFGMAFLTLFQIATGDNWNGIMKDTLREDCDASDDCEKNCCVSPIIAPVYFVVFVLMAQFVLVNVVVAVLMKHLEESHKHMDEDADFEAELEALSKAQEQAALNNLKNPKPIQEIEEKPSIVMTTVADTMPSVNTGDTLEVTCIEENENELKVRNAVTKQISLPPNFTFNVRPPSGEPQLLDDNDDATPGTSTGIGLYCGPDCSSLAVDNSAFQMMCPTTYSSSTSSSSGSNSALKGVYIQTIPTDRTDQDLDQTKQLTATPRRNSLKWPWNFVNQSFPNVQHSSDGEFDPRHSSQQHARSHPHLGHNLNFLDINKVDSPSKRHSRHLLRSQSTGAKYTRIRDKFLKTKCASTEDSTVALFHSKQQPHCTYGQDSVESASEFDETMSNDWADEEAECDEEVKKITGEEEDDDVKPTLSVYASQESGNVFSELSQHSPSLTLTEISDSTQLLHNIGYNTEHLQQCQSKTGTATSSRENNLHMLDYPYHSRGGSSQPGIDNSSFVLGETSNNSNDTEGAAGTGSSLLESQSTHSDVELAAEPKDFLPTATLKASNATSSPSNVHVSDNTPVPSTSVGLTNLSVEETHLMVPSSQQQVQHSIPTLPSRRLSCVSSTSSSLEQFYDSATNPGYQGDELV